MRAYHRIDPLMDERKSHYSPAQLGAFIKVQLLAGRQARRGWFRSTKALLGALPAPYARLVSFLIEQGDLSVQEDGTVYVDGWDEWQEGDLTVKDRMAKLRNRRRNSTVTGTVTNTVTEPYPTAIRSSFSVGVGIENGNGAYSLGSGRPRTNELSTSDARRLAELRETLETTNDPDLRMGIEATIERLVAGL